MPQQQVPTVINEMVRRIVDHSHPEQVILFGSHARGRGGSDSDVDLLVVLQHVASKRKETVALYKLLAGIGVPKDIFLTTRDEMATFRDVAGTVFRAAAREGKVLYERPT